MKQYYAKLAFLVLPLMLLVGLTLTGCGALSETPSGQTVFEVLDGDTIILNNGEHVRLLNILCPELDENGGEVAKEFVEAAVLGETVRLNFGKYSAPFYDVYGRTLANVVRAYDNEDLGELLIEAKLCSCN